MSQENLLTSIKNLVSTVISIASTRLELVSVDVQIARSNFFGLLVMIASALFFFFLGLVMLSMFIVIYYWESNRILALGLLTAGSLFIGLILVLFIMQSLRTMPKLFEASIAELAKDREALAK
jgi:uncharacterized membrane protein YqjE